MKTIDEDRLDSDLDYRFAYVAEFIGFGPADVESLHAAAPLLAPVVPALVDAVYDKLFSYDATKRHFVKRQHGYEGPTPDGVDSLQVDHPMIAFRKQHLGIYLKALVTRPYDGRMTSYLDKIGKMHTPKAGSPDLVVPLVQMNALLGFVADALTATVLGFNLPRDRETALLRAISKLLWIQNDLTTRHYHDAHAFAEAAAV
ncbi:MAG: protoglobin family protein [Planctomycetia bacterium]